MCEEFDKEYEELRKIAKTTENSLKIMRKCRKLCAISLDIAVEKSLLSRFWQAARKLLEAIGKSVERIAQENVQNLIVGELVALSLKVHRIYEVPDYGLPDFLTVSMIVNPAKRRILEKKWKFRIFCGFLMLRLGDLMRYKGFLMKSREFYEISLKINHTERETWNQLGVVHFKSANFLRSIYFHTRSLHSSSSQQYHAAAANLDAIFKKFANRAAHNSSQKHDELVVIYLAKIHFLLDIDDAENVLKALQPSKELICSLMSVYEHLEPGTPLENRAIRHVEIIWTALFNKLLIDLSENRAAAENQLHLLALLLRAPEFCVVLEENPGKIACDSTAKIEDLERFDAFQCLKEHGLRYPITVDQILSKIRGDQSYDQEDEEEQSSEIDSEASYSNSNSGSSSDSDSESKSQDEDSDEEILRAGARRKHVENSDVENEDF
ncbi:unnamed protein product [Caenorhabditis angaria]|uniref:DNA/RNA-binding domain-containing protein n=1 Tax=Caenorhabditis angaria TaxID=860376 RepID=A0A9P1IJV9_9PELO|nr:unnamed protein product [Caenorhabditis angaria]